LKCQMQPWYVHYNWVTQLAIIANAAPKFMQKLSIIQLMGTLQHLPCHASGEDDA